MAEATFSVGKRFAVAAAFVAIAGLTVAYHLATPDRDAPVNAATSVASGSQAEAGVATSVPLVSAKAPETDQALSAPAYPAATATSGLRESELEHLGDVFQNSLYPLFQYDFPLDLEGRSAIDAFVASMPEGLGEADLDQVTAMIEARLLTPEAEDLAFIITHLYRLEQEEARLMSQGEPVVTMEGQLAAQQRLAELRDEWFGSELSALLFPDSSEEPDRADPEATPADGDNLATGSAAPELTETRGELASIENDWERRYQQFLAEKRLIDRAGLDQAEKERQIENLLQQHYEPGEREAAKAYGEQKQ